MTEMYKYDTRKSVAYNNEINHYLPGGVHSNYVQSRHDMPLVFAKAQGSRLTDVDGNEYLDLHSQYGALILGHNHEKYIEAMQQAILTPCAVGFSQITHEVYELLHTHVPSAEMMRFGLSGTEMVSNALRLARAFTGKQKIIRFEKHYHGSADNTLGGTQRKDTDSPKNFDVIFDTKGRANGILEREMIILPWNDYETLENIVSQYHNETAAIIMEIIMMNGGGERAQNEYLHQVRRLCCKYGIILIFDELITGIRLGLGGAQSVYGIVPDLSIYGKAISNGYLPVTVLMGKKEIMELYASGQVVHGGTYNGYPLGMAAVQATLKTAKDIDVYKILSSTGNRLVEILVEEVEKEGLSIEVNGDLACMVLRLQINGMENYDYFGEHEQYLNNLLRHCFASNGILLAPVCRIFPNLSITEEDIEFFSERCRSAIKNIAIVLSRRKFLKNGQSNV